MPPPPKFFQTVKTLEPLLEKAIKEKNASQIELLKEAIQRYIVVGIKKQVIYLREQKAEHPSTLEVSKVVMLFSYFDNIPGDKEFKDFISKTLFKGIDKRFQETKKNDVSTHEVIDAVIWKLKEKLKEYPEPPSLEGANLVLEKGIIRKVAKPVAEVPKAVEPPTPVETAPKPHPEKIEEPKAKEEPEAKPEPTVEAPKPEKVLSQKTVDSYTTHLMRIKIGLGAKEEGNLGEDKWLENTEKVIAWIDNLKSIDGKTLSASAIKTFYASALWKTKEKPSVAEIYRAKMKGLKATTDATPSALAPEPTMPPPPPAPEPEATPLTKPLEKYTKGEIAKMIREHLAKQGKKGAFSHLTKEEMVEAYNTIVKN